MRKAFLFVLSFTLATSTFAQKKGDDMNHLLWRISGNGLSRPSYLFGTMHITDKRLFQFGDSLYRAIENTQSFAAELDMNRIFTQYINHITGQEDELETFVKPSLSSEFIEKHGSKLETMFKKPLGKITLKDVEREEQVRNTKMLKQGEMSTFMDAYLFDIAGRQGKWTGGIEDPEDQFDLDKERSMESRLESMLSTKAEDKKSLEWMIQTYLSENLELIDRTNEIWRGSKDVILLRRNVKMGRRIDSLASIRSGFFAVGAAHLPGDSGLVSLLRAKGYTLTPVISSRHIKPEKYKFTEVEKPWVEVPMLDGSYKVMMPTTPEPFKAMENTILDMKFHFDMGTFTAYFSIGIPATISSEAIRDSMFERITQNYKGSATAFESKPLRIGDLVGKELEMTNQFGNYRMQVFAPGDYVVVNAVFGLKPAELRSQKATRYLASFIPVEKSKKRTATISGWQRFDFKDLGFSVSLPGNYKKKGTEVDEMSSWRTHTFDMIDIIQGRYYSIVVNEAMEGFYADNDTLFLQNVRQLYLEAIKGRELKAEQRLVQDHPAFYFAVKSDESGDSIISELFIISRANRRYMLVKVSQEEQVIGGNDEFFSSFQLLPPGNDHWSGVTSPDNTFTTWAPGEIVYKASTPQNSYDGLLVYDKATSVTSYISKEKLNPFFWAKDQEQFFEKRIPSLVGFSDSVIKKDWVKNGDYPGVDLTIRLGSSANLKRMRLLLYGDSLYTLFSFVSPEVLAQGNYDRFFSEFRILGRARGRNLYKSRATDLLEALKDGDSTTFAEAKEYLGSAPFEVKDLPTLRKAMLYVYRDFDSSYYSNVNASLGEIIRNIDTVDNGTVAFVRKNYPELKEEKNLLKPLLLSILSARKSREAMQLMKELLVSDAPVTDAYYYLNFHTYDSIELCKELFPDLFRVIGDPSLGASIMYAAEVLLDSSLLSAEDIRKERNSILAACDNVFELDEEELVEDAYRVARFPTLLRLLNDDDSRRLLARLLETNVLAVKFQALDALLKLGLKVDSRHFDSLAAADAWRYDLYDSLKVNGRSELFPKKYLNQRMLGQSRIFNMAADEEDPEKIEYIGERVATYEGRQVRFHLYTVMYSEGDPESAYLGIAGPFDLRDQGVNTNWRGTGIYWDENYDEARVGEQFERLLEKQVN